MQTITGGGSFTRKNIQQINQNFAEVSQPDVWVRPQAGNDANDGLTRDTAKATLAGCASLIEPGIVIGLEGVLFEEYSSPIVNDVTIRGMANQPRQATTSGVANGGGATWLAPASGATTHLAIVRGQGWTFENIYFNNATASQACVQLLISGGGDPPADPSGEKATFTNCIFTGARYGLLLTGGPNGTLVQGCTFFGFADSGDTAILSETGAGVHTNSFMRITGCEFYSNATHINLSSFGVEIANNYFAYVRNTVTTTVQIDLAGSDNASIHDNHFDVPYNQAGLSAMFVAGTDDRWAANAMGTAVLTPMTGILWGIPTSGAA